MFSNLLEFKWYTVAVLVCLIVLAVALIIAGKQKRNWTSRRLAYGSMCITIAFILSCIALFKMPQGGTVTPGAMLPLILFALAFGPMPGVVVGCAFGLLQLLQNPYVIHPIQMLLDYPLAYAALALGGLMKFAPVPKWSKLMLAILIGTIGQTAMSVLSGVVFFSEYATGPSVLLYSISYNLSCIGTSGLIACLFALIPAIQKLPEMMRD